MALLKNTSTFISFTLILAIFLILNSSCPATAVRYIPRGENLKYRHEVYTHGDRYDRGRTHKRDPRYGSYHPGRGVRHTAYPWKYPVVATYP